MSGSTSLWEYPARAPRSCPAADLRPLAEALLGDYDTPPVLVLAAWHYLYGWKTEWLPHIAEKAASPGASA